MHCYFNLVSPHQSIIDEEGIAVADADQARTFAREAISEMVQDGVAEIAHWRGWEIEARDASGAVLFTVGFSDLLSRAKEMSKPSLSSLRGKIPPTLTAKPLKPSPVHL